LKAGFTRLAYHGARFGKVAIWAATDADATAAIANTPTLVWRLHEGVLVEYIVFEGPLV
jgi:hypothetical protein